MINQNSQRRARTFIQRLAEFILSLAGWKLAGQRPPYDKYLLIGAHHTSSMDFPLTLLLCAGLGIRFKWIGKDTLFRPPFGWFARRLGGIPVNRRERTNFTGQVIEKYQQADQLVIAISPEGTRRQTPYWRTGFYYIARGARIPLVLAYMDYSTKTCGLGPTIWPTSNIQADLHKIAAFYERVQGRYPERQGRIELDPTGVSQAENRVAEDGLASRDD